MRTDATFTTTAAMTRSTGKLATRRSGFTIVELLTCAGVVSTLVAVLVPALGTARESARRLQCNQNLKQLGLALHSYHEVHRCLPSGWRWDARQETAYGWLPPLLAHLEQNSLQSEVHFESAVNSPENDAVREKTLPLFLCPSDVTERTFMLYAEPVIEGAAADVPLFRLPAANYLGVFGVLEPDDVWQSRHGAGVFSGMVPVRFADISRGLSQVLMVGERRTSTIPSTWLGIDSRGEDAHCRILGNAQRGPNFFNADECEFTSRHPDVANFLWADGHVAAVANSIDSLVYQQLAQRSGSDSEMTDENN